MLWKKDDRWHMVYPRQHSNRWAWIGGSVLVVALVSGSTQFHEPRFLSKKVEGHSTPIVEGRLLAPAKGEMALPLRHDEVETSPAEVPCEGREWERAEKQTDPCITDKKEISEEEKY